MVLGILESIYRSSYFPRSYVPHILLTSLAVVVLHALSQGRKTSRDRDLHARTVILTGAFTSSLGITLLQDLAKRGARVIALSPYKADDPQITILVSLLRTTTGNEEVFAEECDLEDAGEVRKFCTRYLTGGQLPDSEKKEKGKDEDKPPPPPGSAPPPGQGSSTDQRLDAIVFAHEYPHVGAISPFRTRSSSFEEEAKHRERGSLASFLMTTLLLPSLLVAPVDRDIRIINVVNPFYAAASGPSFHDTYPASFSSSPSSASKATNTNTTTSTSGKKRSKPSVFLEEGIRSLRSVILTRHLQRVLDALPAPQAPSTDGTQATVVNPKMQKSNIVAVSVSPGVSRMDTVAPIVNANWGLGFGEGKPSVIGIILYLLLQPILRIFTKSPSSAVQTVLHALFLPTPFKSLSMRIAEQEAAASSSSSSKEDKSDSGGTDKTPSSSSSSSPSKLKKPQPVFREVLKPGALYSDCAVVVSLKVPPPPPPPSSSSSSSGSDDMKKDSKKTKKEKSEKGKAKEKEKEKGEELDISIEDDGDYGGEAVGRVVWEAYEGALKLWEGSSGQTSNAGAGKKTASG
ncbi:hypothetical protein MD484_g2694, partial [Candolleomyces efflorescens]